MGHFQRVNIVVKRMALAKIQLSLYLLIAILKKTKKSFYMCLAYIQKRKK